MRQNRQFNMIPRKHKPLRRAGQSSRSAELRAWDRELKAYWIEQLLPTYCELRLDGCMGTFGIALAHSKKRRFIDTRQLYFTVAALCQKCHEFIEHGGHDEMERVILEVIAKRDNG